MELGFTPAFFDPAKKGAVDKTLGLVTVHGDAPHHPSYVYNRSIILAVNLARATRRPLFIGGKPGTGKTTLAANVARVLGWKYYQRTVTSRMRAKDLLWSFDSLRRLSHAQERRALPPRAAYVEPQEFWWAFSPETARWRGAAAGKRRSVTEATDPVRFTPPRSTDATPAVVLVDEIDKADPDVPNDLLEVLDVGRFQVDELDEQLPVKADQERVLLMITSNGERELPPAFLRRCVVLHLTDPDPAWLVKVADDRFGAAGHDFHREIAEKVMVLRDVARDRDLREPSTAEFLDAVAACRRLGIDAQGKAWQLVSAALLSKREPEADKRDSGQ